jgi:dTDP-4-amino-4,6-dideoxygalactose transaminase
MTMEKIPITRPFFTDAEANAVAEVLASGWVSQGHQVAAFEGAFARYVGARHAIAVTSCTSALHLALHALGIGPGDDVLLPSFTFVATANAVEYCGARPVFVDIDLATFNVDVERLETAITPRTRAVIPVHLFGLSADMSAVRDVARRHDLVVIEDAACAVGTRYGDRHVGTLEQAGCFSFHPRKLITTGEGGMITTDDTALADHLRSLRSHAASVPDAARHDAAGGFLLPAFAEIGFNYRMTDIQAAIGLAQLAKLEEILRRRIALAATYTEALREIPWLRTAPVPASGVHAFQSYVVLVLTDAPRSRDGLAHHLESLGIATRQGTHAVHALAYYRKRYGLNVGDCPVAWRADTQSLALPLFSQMSAAEQQRVVAALREIG